MNKKVELLIPAGSLEVLKVAVDYGADAVYVGGSSYGLRAKAGNFDYDQMKQGINYAHSKGVKLYVTVNIFAHNNDLNGIRQYLDDIKDFGIDALIISDPGIFTIAKEIMPEMEIHISTQANNTNYEIYKFWYKLGAKRVVAARELSLDEIKEIKSNIDSEMEIEAFMHGAMCISYSGRCLLSSYFTGKDGNQGACTHPCRWKYAIVEEQRPGEYLPIEEDERGTYIFNSKDLCMIEYIPEMIEAGIDSFKVEGRMKTALYCAAVTRTYRQAIDDYYESVELYNNNIKNYKDEISACTFRQFTTGFYFGKPDHESQIYDINTYIKNYTYLGIVDDITEEGYVSLTQKNKFSVGDEVEVMGYKSDDANNAFNNICVRVEGIFDEKMRGIISAPHPKQRLFVKFSSVDNITSGMVIRVKHCEVLK